MGMSYSHGLKSVASLVSHGHSTRACLLAMGESQYGHPVLARLVHMGVSDTRVRHTAWSHGRVTLTE